MSEEAIFGDFIRRIRAGDDRAAEELVRTYEPLVRREIRINSRDRRMARLFDSVDVCQSIWTSFFVRAAAGQFELDSPQHLAKLLAAMAKNKLASQARKYRYQKRDVGRIDASNYALDGVSDDQPTPSDCVSAKELFKRLHESLTDDERQVVDLRREGFSWKEVAESLGGTAQARRMQLDRAADRVIGQLGLEE
jgi:RNA polymerase sigma-70 factor (ECF subfamily)